MAGIAQNRQQHLIFIAVPQVRKKMREKFRKCNAIDKMIFNMENKTLSLIVHIKYH